MFYTSSLASCLAGRCSGPGGRGVLEYSKLVALTEGLLVERLLNASVYLLAQCLSPLVSLYKFSFLGSNVVTCKATAHKFGQVEG